MPSKYRHIVVSRTDGIGDVILTLPMIGALREHFPDARITLLGRSYTAPIAAGCTNIDAFANWDEVSAAHPAGAKQAEAEFIRKLNADLILHVFPRKEVVRAAYTAGCPIRVATGRRWHTLMSANRKVWFSRKGSELHEAVLNLKMLEAIGLKVDASDDRLCEWYGFQPTVPVPTQATQFVAAEKTVLLHPLSHGSALEWPVEAFAELAHQLCDAGFSVGITGTARERNQLGDQLPWGKVTDFCGALSLDELIAVIGASSGVVAASTGPLHIAAALGRHALGLYSPKPPIYPVRWRPIGTRAEVLVDATHPADGKLKITPDEVAARVLKWNAR